MVEWNDMPAAEKLLPLLNDSGRVNLLLTLSYSFRVRDGNTKPQDLEKALSLAEQARGLAIRLHQKEKEILAIQDIAAVHMDQGKKGTEQELLDVIAKYRSIGFRRLHYAYNLLTNFYKSKGNDDKALYYSFETIKSMRATGDSLAAGDFYLWHASIFLAIDEFQQCIDYC